MSSYSSSSIEVLDEPIVPYVVPFKQPIVFRQPRINGVQGPIAIRPIQRIQPTSGRQQDFRKLQAIQKLAQAIIPCIAARCPQVNTNFTGISIVNFLNQGFNHNDPPVGSYYQSHTATARDPEDYRRNTGYCRFTFTGRQTAEHTPEQRQMQLQFEQDYLNYVATICLEAYNDSQRSRPTNQTVYHQIVSTFLDTPEVSGLATARVSPPNSPPRAQTVPPIAAANSPSIVSPRRNLSPIVRRVFHDRTNLPRQIHINEDGQRVVDGTLHLSPVQPHSPTVSMIQRAIANSFREQQQQMQPEQEEYKGPEVAPQESAFSVHSSSSDSDSDSDEGMASLPSAYHFRTLAPPRPPGMKFFPSIHQPRRQVINMAGYRALFLLRLEKFGIRGDRLLGLIREQIRLRPTIRINSILTTAPSGQAMIFPPTIAGSPFNRLTCGYNPNLLSSFYMNTPTQNILTIFTHQFLSTVFKKGCTFPSEFKCYQVTGANIMHYNREETLAFPNELQRLYYIDTPFVNSRFNVMIRTRHIKCTDDFALNITNKSSADWMIQQIPFLKNDLQYQSSTQPKPLYLTALQDTVKFMQTKKIDFLENFSIPRLHPSFKKFSDLFTALEERPIEQLHIANRFLKLVSSFTTVPDDISKQTYALVTTESITSYDQVLNPTARVQNKHEIFQDLLISGCNGLAGVYLYFPENDFIVPFKLGSDINSYIGQERDANLISRLNQIVPLYASAISVCKKPKPMQDEPTPFPLDDPNFVSQLYAVKNMAPLIGFNNGLKSMIQAVFRPHTVSVNELLTTPMNSFRNLGVVLRTGFFRDSYTHTQAFFPQIKPYDLKTMDTETGGYQKALCEILMDHGLTNLLSNNIDLSIRKKMNWFAQFSFFMNLKSEYWSNLNQNAFVMRAAVVGEAVEDQIFRPIFHQAQPRVAAQPNVLGKRAYEIIQVITVDNSDSDYEPTASNFQNQRRARHE